MSAPAAPGHKRCLVCYATRTRAHLWQVELPLAADIAAALAAAREACPAAERAAIPWDSAAVGIFGEPRLRSDGCADGDRIELYRALRRDPRAGRRERVQRARRGAR